MTRDQVSVGAAARYLVRKRWGYGPAGLARRRHAGGRWNQPQQGPAPSHQGGRW